MIFISIWVNETEIGRGPVWKKKKNYPSSVPSLTTQDLNPGIWSLDGIEY
jgi:hypothetical protein